MPVLFLHLPSWLLPFPRKLSHRPISTAKPGRGTACRNSCLPPLSPASSLGEREDTMSVGSGSRNRQEVGSPSQRHQCKFFQSSERAPSALPFLPKMFCPVLPRERSERHTRPAPMLSPVLPNAGGMRGSLCLPPLSMCQCKMKGEKCVVCKNCLLPSACIDNAV